MWNSASASSFVGINRDSETTLQSIGQYIEDYIDLVENVPNDIVRGITQFHEKNHVYHQLLDKLERALEKTVIAENEETRRKALDLIQRYLIQIQSLSDEKLQVCQSMYDQLEIKARQLDHDFRAVTGSGRTNIFSPVKAADRGRGYNNTYARTNGTSQANNKDSEESQDSSTSPDNETDNQPPRIQEEPVGRRTGAKKRKARVETNHHDDDDELDIEDTPIKDGGKRTRRINKTAKTDKNRSAADLDENSRDDSSARVGRVSNKGGKSGGTVSSKTTKESQSKRRGRDRDNSPTSVYDEPSPLDPDEPTYCVCQQISFGEMIGCDNNRCPIEWFHFQCVGLVSKPKGKWYCPACRGDRPNIQKKNS